MPELMSQGFALAVYGMGTVFFFLTLLVFATMVMSALVPDEIDHVVPQSGGGSDPRILRAIAAAIHQHRARH